VCVSYSNTIQVLKADNVDLMIIARCTPGFSGADLANLVDVAALRAAKDGAKAVSTHDLEFAREKIIMGSQRKSAVISEESRKKTAFHECGHALVAIYTDGANPIHKATIVPRGMALGMVSQLPPRNDQTSLSRKQMLARLDICMGGRVAEELIFGQSGVTSGASSDLFKATSLARQMVTRYGMSTEVGPVSHNYFDNGRSMSSETRLLIEKEVKNLLERAYNNAKIILTTHEKELHVLAKALLKHETLTGSQIKDLLAKVKSQQKQQQSRPVNAQGSSRSNPTTDKAADATTNAAATAPSAATDATTNAVAASDAATNATAPSATTDATTNAAAASDAATNAAANVAAPSDAASKASAPSAAAIAATNAAAPSDAASKASTPSAAANAATNAAAPSAAVDAATNAGASSASAKAQGIATVAEVEVHSDQQGFPPLQPS